jgi:hypothetical protein
MLKAIDETRKYNLYVNAFKRALQRYRDNPEQDPLPVMKKLIFYGVRTINLMPKRDIITRSEIENNFIFAEFIKDAMALLTPGEFVNLFPVTKNYDGDTGWKDYFYTAAYLKTLPQDKPIDSEIDDFLWEFMNIEIHMFLVKLIGFTSDLRRLDGHKGLMEEFCEEQGIRTFTKHRDNRGKEYMIDNQTGRTAPIKKQLPKHLKVIKCNT